MQDIDKIVRTYMKMVAGLDTRVGVYTQTELCIDTFIPDIPEIEEKIYEAERLIHQKWPNILINFRVIKENDA